MLFFDAYAVDEESERISQKHYSHKKRYVSDNGLTLMEEMLANKEFQKILRQYFPKNINFEETIKDILDGRYQIDEEFRHKINKIIATLPPDIKEQAFSVKTEIDFTHRANALRKILFMNARLPQEQKISAVSISWGMLGTNPESKDLIRQLIESGVMVLTTDYDRFYGKVAGFLTVDRKMNSRDKWDSPFFNIII